MPSAKKPSSWRSARKRERALAGEERAGRTRRVVVGTAARRQEGAGGRDREAQPQRSDDEVPPAETTALVGVDQFVPLLLPPHVRPFRPSQRPANDQLAKSRAHLQGACQPASLGIEDDIGGAGEQSLTASGNIRPAADGGGKPEEGPGWIGYVVSGHAARRAHRWQ